MLITVDFDGTLDKPDITKFIIDKIKEGHRAYVVTSRLSEKRANREYGQNLNRWNSDVIELSEKVGISKIFFTNYERKVGLIRKLTPDLHLDDDGGEVSEINSEVPETLALDIKRSNWKQTANELLDKEKLGFY